MVGKKIVQINSSCGSGSTGKIVAAISDLLDEAGVENYIFYSGFKIHERKNTYVINSLMDIRIHQVLSRVFGDQGWHSYIATKKMINKLESIKPDLVHLHNLHGYYLNMDVLFKYLAKSGIPVVWTLHDCWAFTGHCSHFTMVKCEQWKSHCSYCVQKHAYPYSLFFDRSKQLFDRKMKLYKGVADISVTTVSSWLKNMVEESVLLGSRNVYVIPNGINIEIFKPMKPLRSIEGTELINKRVVLGVANTWGERKGLKDFIKLRSILGEEFIIILVGLSEQQITELPSGIIGIKKIENVQQLAELYSTADVYFNSSDEETFGLTTIEAMACGTPVIVYDSTACPEAVAKGTGIVVKPHDINAVKIAIEIIISKRFFSSEELRKYICNHYDENCIYRNYIELYEDVLSGRTERTE